MKSFESWIASIASLLVVAVSATNVALAHGGYSTTWGGTNAPYQFTSSFPGGNGERNSVRQGADQWTDTPNANFTWQELGEVSNWTPSTNCGAEWAQNQSINWKSIDGGGNQSVLADALWCSFNGTIFKYWIRFDKDNAADFFWPGTGAPPVPSGMYDGRAIASHEFGHATGFSAHIGSNTSYCDEGSLDYHTMCQTILAGKARQRTLEAHDVNTFQQSY